MRELQTFRSPKDKVRILQRINIILGEIEDMAADYVRNDLPEQYKIGSALAVAELRKLRMRDIETGFSGIHREAVKQLANDARLRFANTVQAVKREATVKIAAATKELILQEIMVRELSGGRNATAAVTDLLRGQGIAAIQTRNGRRSLEDYADMLVRSISADAHNEGAAIRYAENGVEYARVIERDTACKICRPMDDKIVWLGDPRLRPKYHPRCQGGIEPVLGIPNNPIRSPDDPRIPQVTRDAMLRR